MRNFVRKKFPRRLQEGLTANSLMHWLASKARDVALLGLAGHAASWPAGGNVMEAGVAIAAVQYEHFDLRSLKEVKYSGLVSSCASVSLTQGAVYIQEIQQSSFRFLLLLLLIAAAGHLVKRDKNNIFINFYKLYLACVQLLAAILLYIPL